MNNEVFGREGLAQGFGLGANSRIGLGERQPRRRHRPPEDLPQFRSHSKHTNRLGR